MNSIVVTFSKIRRPELENAASRIRRLLGGMHGVSVHVRADNDASHTIDDCPEEILNRRLSDSDLRPSALAALARRNPPIIEVRDIVPIRPDDFMKEHILGLQLFTRLRVWLLTVGIVNLDNAWCYLAKLSYSDRRRIRIKDVLGNSYLRHQLQGCVTIGRVADGPGCMPEKESAARLDAVMAALGYVRSTTGDPWYVPAEGKSPGS